MQLEYNKIQNYIKSFNVINSEKKRKKFHRQNKKINLALKSKILKVKDHQIMNDMNYSRFRKSLFNNPLINKLVDQNDLSNFMRLFS